jgi:hypothetical protein
LRQALRLAGVTGCAGLLLGVVLALAAGAAQARGGAARASLAATARADSPAMVVTPNWAGYVATAPSGSGPLNFTSVTGTWTVPSASCAAGAGAALSTAWVGLGGLTTSRQEEVGTDSGCDASGKPVYFAWFELVPYIAYHVNGMVEPGDTITGLVKVLGLALVQLQVANVTRGWTFTRNITFSPMDTSTADWIVESPATCVRWVCKEANLANFGTLNMTGISATTAGGETGTLTDPNWQVIPIQLIPGQMTIPTLDPEATASSRGSASSSAGATPGGPSADGSSFSVTWVPKPVPPV